jgi:hypothetical protein
MRSDVSLEHLGETLHPVSDVGVPIATRHEVEGLFDPGAEEPLLTPGEGGDECCAGAERQGDVRRRE